jgi:hypothetical protein
VIFLTPDWTVLVIDWPFELVVMVGPLLAGFRRIAGVDKIVVALPIAVDAITAGVGNTGFTVCCVSIETLPATTTPSFWSTFGTIFSGTTGAPPSAFAADCTTGS